MYMLMYYLISCTVSSYNEVCCPVHRHLSVLLVIIDHIHRVQLPGIQNIFLNHFLLFPRMVCTSHRSYKYQCKTLFLSSIESYDLHKAC